MNFTPRLIIPAILLVATITGSAYAIYLVTTFVGTTNVVEDISVNPPTQTIADITPNGDATFTFTVANSATLAQGIQLDVSLTAPSGTCLSAFAVDGHTVTLSACASSSAPETVPASGSVSVSITVHAAGDAALGSVTLNAAVSRTA